MTFSGLQQERDGGGGAGQAAEGAAASPVPALRRSPALGSQLPALPQAAGAGDLHRRRPLIYLHCLLLRCQSQMGQDQLGFWCHSVPARALGGTWEQRDGKRPQDRSLPILATGKVLPRSQAVCWFAHRTAFNHVKLLHFLF